MHQAQRLPVLLVVLTLTLGGSLMHAGDATSFDAGPSAATPSGANYRPQWLYTQDNSDGTYDAVQSIGVTFYKDGSVRLDMVSAWRQIRPDCYVQGIHLGEVGQVTPYNQGDLFQVTGDQESLDTCHNQVTHTPIKQVLYWKVALRGNQLELADGLYWDGHTQQFRPLTGIFRHCLLNRTY